MIKQDRYCIDLLNQALDVRSALSQVELLILEDHSARMREEAIVAPDSEAQRRKSRELVDVFEKVCHRRAAAERNTGWNNTPATYVSGAHTALAEFHRSASHGRRSAFLAHANGGRRMSYTINRKIDGVSFEEAVSRTRSALADQGFGVLTEIDAKATMKKKLDVEMDPYLILGACNPKMAHQAIGMEPRVGAMLPCNVIVRQVEGGVEVSAIDPVASMTAIDNHELKRVAGEVRDLLGKAVDRI